MKRLNLEAVELEPKLLQAEALLGSEESSLSRPSPSSSGMVGSMVSKVSSPPQHLSGGFVHLPELPAPVRIC